MRVFISRLHVSGHIPSYTPYATSTDFSWQPHMVSKSYSLRESCSKTCATTLPQSTTSHSELLYELVPNPSTEGTTPGATSLQRSLICIQAAVQ